MAGGKGSLRPEITAPMLKRVLHMDFPDLSPLLDFFSKEFDQTDAERNGKITPLAGSSSVYDDALEEVAAVEKRFEDYLQEQRVSLRIPNLAFFSTIKDRYQIEVPMDHQKNVPSDWTFKSQKKGSGKTGGVSRYWSSEVTDMLLDLDAAQERRDAAGKDSLRKIFAKFDSHKASWDAAASSLATLDCLLSLARWSKNPSDAGVVCRPELVECGADESPFMSINGARHPTMSISIGSGSSALSGSPSSFIPNDISLGGLGRDDLSSGSGAPCILLTGPNMGGKSTYLRTACTTVIMAQLGCFVPATSCRLTPVDRIFTRVGASDRILAAQSTFFVELAETSAILSQASKHSLVILDELGRGTSTFDGNAIAYAVTRHLTKNVGCRTLFATHYHTLCDDFGKDRDVELGHMACVVEEKKATMEDEKEESGGKSTSDASVTFLYTYQHGACPKSYGLNVARLARLPEGVIQRAKEKSEEFETAVESLRLQSRLIKKARLALTEGEGDAALDEFLNTMI